MGPQRESADAFPVLDQMAKNLAWTSALGDAAFNQQGDVMAAIQKLRRKAKAAGNLKPRRKSRWCRRARRRRDPAGESAGGVRPTYNPTVVYGTPYNPPGTARGAVTTGLISFGVGMAIGASMNNNCCGWGYYGGGWGCNWHGGNVMYQNNVYVSRSNTFYGNNRYQNNSYYKNNNCPVPYNNNNRYNGGNNRANNAQNNKTAWNSGNRNSGNTVNRGGNTVNVNGDVNVGNKNNNKVGNNNGNNRPGNNNNGNNRPGNNNAGNNRPGNNNAGANRPNNNAGGNRPGAGANNKAAADRGFGGNPKAANTSATGGYKQGGNARADSNRGKQSMGASGGGGARQAPASRPAGGGARKK